MKQNYFIIYIYLDKLEKQNNLLKNNRLFCLINVTAEVHFPNTFVEDLNKIVQLSSINTY